MSEFTVDEIKRYLEKVKRNPQWHIFQNRVIKELGINSTPITIEQSLLREQAYVERMRNAPSYIFSNEESQLYKEHFYKEYNYHEKEFRKYEQGENEQGENEQGENEQGENEQGEFKKDHRYAFRKRIMDKLLNTTASSA